MNIFKITSKNVMSYPIKEIINLFKYPYSINKNSKKIFCRDFFEYKIKKVKKIK